MVDVGEMVLGLFWVFVCDIQAHMVDAMNLHLLVYGAGHDVAWCERQTLVIFLHERLAVGKAKNAAITAHGLGDEVGGVGLAGMIE